MGKLPPPKSRRARKDISLRIPPLGGAGASCHMRPIGRLQQSHAFRPLFAARHGVLIVYFAIKFSMAS